MRQLEKSTPRIQLNNSYSDIEDEATPNEQENKYAEFTQEFIVQPFGSTVKSPMIKSPKSLILIRETP